MRIFGRSAADDRWSPKPTVFELTGWEAVQQNMRLHDEDMIKDFSEDIDTLLSFVRAAYPCLAGRS